MTLSILNGPYLLGLVEQGIYGQGLQLCLWWGPLYFPVGSTLHPEYKLVGMLWYIALRIPFYITLAAISPSMLLDIQETLHIHLDSLFFQRSNDQHNIAFSVKKMQYNASSFEDLVFLVPSTWSHGDMLPQKFMVFFDSKCESELASRFLWSQMPKHLKDKVKWFHVGMTQFFRTEELQSFRYDDLWGLGMTDIGGMVSALSYLDVATSLRYYTHL